MGVAIRKAYDPNPSRTNALNKLDALEQELELVTMLLRSAKRRLGDGEVGEAIIAIDGAQRRLERKVLGIKINEKGLKVQEGRELENSLLYVLTSAIVRIQTKR